MSDALRFLPVDRRNLLPSRIPMTVEHHTTLLMTLAHWRPAAGHFGQNVAQPLAVQLSLALPVDRVSVWIYRGASSDALECIALHDVSGLANIPEPLRASSFPRYFSELQSARALAAGDAVTDARTRELGPTYLEPLGIRSMLDAPLFSEGRLAGIVCCEGRAPRAWSDGEGRLVASVADLLGRILAEHEREETKRLATREIARREELYRRVVEELDDMILRSEPSGQVVFANDAAYRFVHGSAIRQGPENLMNYVPSEERVIVKDAVAQLTPESPATSYEHHVIRHDGVRVLHSFRLRAFFDDQGHLEGYQAIGRNVELERRRQATLREAERIEALAVLSTGIAHDFNNLLMPIMAFSEFLLRESHDERTSEPLRQILQASERARDLVRQILTFARRSKGKSPVQCALAIREAVAFIRVALPGNVSLVCDIDDDCGEVYAQPTDLYQIVSNLCTNAIQAMPIGGTLTVQASSSSGTLQLLVRDTGVGMTDEVRARIFEPFFTTKGLGEGTGLGLAVVHGTVRSLDGVVDVQSTPGLGTTFVVQLPLEARRDPSSNEARTSGALTVHRTLVIDDDAAVLASVRATLESFGFPVTTRQSAAEGLLEWQRVPGRYGLILCDLTMPQTSGVDLLFRVRQQAPSFPIVLMTGFAELLRGTDRTLPADVRLLPKPFTREELHQALLEVLVKHPSGGEDGLP